MSRSSVFPSDLLHFHLFSTHLIKLPCFPLSPSNFHPFSPFLPIFNFFYLSTKSSRRDDRNLRSCVQLPKHATLPPSNHSTGPHGGLQPPEKSTNPEKIELGLPSFPQSILSRQVGETGQFPAPELTGSYLRHSMAR